MDHARVLWALLLRFNNHRAVAGHVFWQPSSVVWWEFTGAARVTIDAGWFGSWALLFYSFFLNGIGYQTGFTPWWHWIRGRPIPPRPFNPQGVFRIMRHPAYLSFLGLVWFTPVMTTDRAILTAVWTVYVFVGSYLKDRRLALYLGEPYRRYMAEVPGLSGHVPRAAGTRASGLREAPHPKAQAAQDHDRHSAEPQRYGMPRDQDFGSDYQTDELRNRHGPENDACDS